MIEHGPVTIRDLSGQIIQTISIHNNPGSNEPITIYPIHKGTSLIVIEVEKMDNLDYIELLATERGLI